MHARAEGYVDQGLRTDSKQSIDSLLLPLSKRTAHRMAQNREWHLWQDSRNERRCSPQKCSQGIHQGARIRRVTFYMLGWARYIQYNSDPYEKQDSQMAWACHTMQDHLGVMHVDRTAQWQQDLLGNAVV